MATEPSSDSTIIAWTWAIESLASLEHIDVSDLIDLVKSTPGGTDNLGRSAREIFSFKALKSLFVPKSGIAKGVSSSSPDSSIGFDSSESCANVLERIVLEVPGSNLQDESEKSKCDIQPFIMHKRSSLPKCALEQLKDAILEGSHPCLAPLKEKSGLVHPNQSESRLDSFYGDSNSFAHKIEGSSTDLQAIANENAFSVHAEDKDDLFGENVQNKNLSTPKRVWNSSAANNHVKTANEDQITLERRCDTHSHIDKKLKHDHTCIRQTLDQNSFSLHGSDQLENTTGKRIQLTETRECEFTKEPLAVGGSECTGDHHEEYTASKTLEQGCDTLFRTAKKLKPDHTCIRQTLDQNLFSLHGSDQLEDSSGRRIQLMETAECEFSKEPQAVGGSWCTGDDHEEYTAPKTLEQVCDVGNAILDNQQAPSNENKVAVDVCMEGPDKSVSGDEGNEEHKGSDEVRKVNNETKFHMEPESFDYDAGYLNEMTDIATKKHALLSQKCVNRGEILVETHWKDLNICVKCNKGGQLLVCSSDACPLVFHETCLNSLATLDMRGNFYCYFCTYSQLLSQFQDIKKRYSLFRNNIAAFISVMSDGEKNFFHKSCVSEQTAQRLDQKYEAKDSRKRNVMNQVGGTQCEANTKEVGKAQPSVLYALDHEPCKDDVEAVTNGKRSVLLDDKPEEERMGCLGQSPRGLEEQLITTHAVDRCQKHAGLRIQRGIPSSPVSDLPREPGCSKSIGCKRSSVSAHEKSVSSNYSLRIQKDKLQNRYPESPQTRRMNPPWTKLEEETLKEGVKIFSNFQERGIPWSKILEFGGDAFQKCRTNIDLKDKWRNLCKASEDLN